MFWLAKFFTKGKSVKDAIAYFFKLNNRMPNNIEIIKIKNAFMDQTRKSNVIDITSRIKDEWWKERPGFKRQHPEVTKKIKESDDLIRSFEQTTGEKVDKDTYSALLERQSKELEGIDTKQGTGFYSDMSDIMKKHDLEQLEFKYDEMFNKILEKAKRIERDPKVLLEAELGTKLTGEETTTQLLDLFSKRPKKASGGIARVGFGKGKLVIDFIEKLFIKASNDIRLGKGKWAGLTQEQWIKQHDDLTKMLKKWEWGGKKGLPEGAEQYLGMNDLQIARAVKEAEKKVKNPLQRSFSLSREKLVAQFPNIPEGEINRIMKLPVDEQKEMLTKLMAGDERTALKQKYPGIADELVDKILVDANPQRKAEVMATMDEYLKLREIGKSESEAYDIITKSFKKIPTKHASGGIAGQLHLNRTGYAGGKSTFPKQLSLFARPKIGDALKTLSDAELKRQMKEMKKRWGVSVSNKASGGLAHVLGV